MVSYIFIHFQLNFALRNITEQILHIFLVALEQTEMIKIKFQVVGLYVNISLIIEFKITSEYFPYPGTIGFHYWQS